MHLVAKVGDAVLKTLKEIATIDWILPDFSALSDKVNDFYYSPAFSFAESRWRLVLYPNGEDQLSEGWVDLYLVRTDHGPPRTLRFTLGIRGLNAAEKARELKNEFSTEDNSSGFLKFWSRSDLKNRRATLLPNDELTVTCELRSGGALSVVTGNEQLEKEVGSSMGQIKTLQKTVEKFEVESENLKKQISASESIGLRKGNEQLEKEVESLMGQMKTLQKTVEKFEVESENLKTQIIASESIGLRKVIFLGTLLFIVLEIMSFMIVLQG